MKKATLGLLGIMLLLVLSCQMNGNNGSGDIVMNFSLKLAGSRTAMPNGLNLRPDYFFIQGAGPGGASVEAYFVLPAGSGDLDTYEFGLNDLVTGNWTFTVLAYEWIGNSSSYNPANQPIDGKPIGESEIGCVIHAGLITPIDITLTPYTGQYDGTAVTYSMKVTFDWSSAEWADLRATMQNPRLVVDILGPFGSYTITAPDPADLDAGLVTQIIDLDSAGSYSVYVELWEGDTRLFRRIESAYITANLLTHVYLQFYLNPRRNAFTLTDAIPNPISLKAMAVVYNIDTAQLRVEPVLLDDEELVLGANEFVMLFGWSPTGAVNYCDWYGPMNHPDAGTGTMAGGLEKVFGVYETELETNFGVPVGSLSLALEDAGVDMAAMVGMYPDDSDFYYEGTLFYTTDQPSPYERDGHMVYTDGIWPFSFETWTMDPWGNTLFSMTDVMARIE